MGLACSRLIIILFSTALLVTCSVIDELTPTPTSVLDDPFVQEFCLGKGFSPEPSAGEIGTTGIKWADPRRNLPDVVRLAGVPEESISMTRFGGTVATDPEARVYYQRYLRCPAGSPGERKFAIKLIRYMIAINTT
jgi:hypothetical protein